MRPMLAAAPLPGTRLYRRRSPDRCAIWCRDGGAVADVLFKHLQSCARKNTCNGGGDAEEVLAKSSGDRSDSDSFGAGPEASREHAKKERPTKGNRGRRVPA